MSEMEIGLFGTCGTSKWREPFIEKYKKMGISFYNPKVNDWNIDFAKKEAQHLANDKIILFPITSETYGLGSLSEIGFSVLNAIKLDDRRTFVILIDDYLNVNLEKNDLREESIRSRALVKQHLKKLNMSNVYLVNSLEETFMVSVTLYQSEILKESINKYSLVTSLHK